MSYTISSNKPPKSDSILAIKKAKEAAKQASLNANNDNQNEEASGNQKTTLGTPTIGVNFQGNYGGGRPSDNTIAISNGGMIVSLENSNLAYYTESGTYLNSMSLVDFYNSPTLSTSLCDPKIIYDSGADRFIFFSQVCDGVQSNSYVLMAFSKSNNPNANGWWWYKLTGNPLADNSWFDYPKIGISTNEVFVTGNLFYESGGYNESVIYQMEKNDGYTGASLSWQWWHGISGNPFTLLPISYGQQGAYGPGIYLIASSWGGSSELKFYNLTDDMAATNEALNYYSIATPTYSVAPSAYQSGSSYKIDVGDCRMQDGFYLDDTAHFVYSVDSGAYSTIRYNRMSIYNLKHTYRSISFLGTKDYSYPAVASYTTSSTDKSAIVSFLSTGSSIYPEMRAKVYDTNFGTSSSFLVRAGDGYVDDCYDSNRDAMRWGDYSGISRKHNSAIPRVWVNGSYGGGNTSWKTWISEIYDGGNSAISENQSPITEANVFPNPATRKEVAFTFSSDKILSAKFNLYDMQGKLIKEVYEGTVVKGKNHFSIDTRTLSNGVYTLNVVTSDNQIIYHEKIVIAD